MSKQWKRHRGKWEQLIEAMQQGVDQHVYEALNAGGQGQGQWHLDRARALREEICLLKEWILWQES